MEQYKKDFIEFMIESDVLKFGQFITKSGRETPFFINTGNYTTGEQLKKLGEFYSRAIKENFTEEFDVLFGPAYKGIPLVVTTSMGLKNLYDMDVSYCSNRKEIKDHGDKGILLGHKLKDGDRVLIVEDVTTAGTSIYETMPILNSSANIELLGLIISVDRMEKGRGEKSALVELKEKFGLRSVSIVTMDEIVEYLYNREINGRVLIDDKLRKEIEDYYKIYGIR